MIISLIKPLDWQLFFSQLFLAFPFGEPLYFSLKFTDKSARVGKHKKVAVVIPTVIFNV